MADDQNLSGQDIQDLQSIASKLPAGHPTQKKIALLLSSQPTQFEEKGGRLPSEIGPQEKFNDAQEEAYRTAYAKEHETHPNSLVLTDADTAMLGLGGASIVRQIAKQGIKASIRPIAKSLIGAAAGSAAGGYGGRGIGGIFGHPEEGAQIGATIGGLAGGFYGGIREPVPEEGPFVPASKSPGRYRGPNSVEALKPALGSPENPGMFSKLPTRLPAGLRGDPFSPPIPTVEATPVPAELGSPENPGLFSKLPTRLPSNLHSDPFQPRVSPLDPTATPVEGTSRSNTNSQDLISRMKKIAVPGEEPTSADLKRAGDLTQASTEKLRVLDKFGDRLAHNELMRRLKQ